jgi:hypothetical protein
MAKRAAMSAFHTYRTGVIDAVDDVPVSPDPGLDVAGWTLLPAVLIRVRREVTVDWDAALGFDPADQSYLGLFWPGHPVRTVPLRAGGQIPEETAKLVGVEPGEARLSVTWIEPTHLLVTVPFVVRTRDDHDIPHLTSAVGSGIDAVLHGVRGIRQPEAAAWIVAAARRHIAGIAGEGSVEQATLITDALGVELWDLRGSDRHDDTTYAGIAESRRFAWQLSALKSHGSRHVVDHGRWREQRREHVASELRYGYTFLDDHLASVNASCCLEVCNVLTSTLTASVHDRLIRYGYDSSAIFVWSLELLRGATARDLVQDYGSRTVSLLSSHAMSRAEYAALVADVAVDSAVVESLDQLPRMLREGRNRALQEEVALLRASDADVRQARIALDRASGFGRDLRAVDQQRRSTEAGIFLAAFAAALAALGVPPLIDVLSKFAREGQVIELSISIGALLIALVACVALVRAGLRTD